MQPVPACPSTRVVIADDRPRTLRALRALLATHPGFQVVGEAADGEAAIEAVERLRPDAVLLDLRMPRFDGITATARIKARWPEVRVVAHSLAHNSRDDALTAGADAFVPKGAPISTLLRVLHGPCEDAAIGAPRPHPIGDTSGDDLTIPG